MVTSSETIVGTKIFLGNFKLLCTRHVGTRLYRSFSIVWGGAPSVWAGAWPILHVFSWQEPKKQAGSGHSAKKIYALTRSKIECGTQSV